jgi:hypothetical protein
MNMEQAQEKLKQWEETMQDADAELSEARGTRNKDNIREAQEVWHWAKAKLDEASSIVVKLQLGVGIAASQPEASQPETEEE